MDQEVNKYRNSFDSIDLIVFIKKHFKTLLIISFIGAVVSAIISLTITPLYKSTVIMFPTPSTSVSKALLTESVSAKAVSTFGEEEEVEQLLQVLQSDEIREKVIRKHNLMEHYDIDPDSKFKYTNLTRTYNSHVEIERTKFMSIKIEVLDKEPEMAAAIANDIAMLVDSTMNRMQKPRVMMALDVVKNEYLDLKHQIETLEDSLNTLRDLGVYDYESQAEVYSDAYAQAIAKGLTRNVKELEEKMKILAKYGGAYVSIRDFLEHEKKHLSEVKARYAEARVDAEQDLPHKYIVDHARVAEKKSYPIRWLIVVISTFSTFVLTLITLILVEVFFKK